ncbi:hypothetical protein UCDDA912_g00304 [Diaporthe ampelina]|uniref:Uncharacterized protein n=1 Tax=Diaporthe ampelina TaxID=1214573 RepID=A0A0G2G025_9PEZI|nr:hypothetical protein UCDDA912_g00304 [Diaporthe ampelina]
MVSTTAKPDSELFCSVSSTQKVPERHPSTLIPGGHASPLRHPTVLRPGAGNHHARRSSSETPHTPARHHQRASSKTPKPEYKAYSPPATPQDPRASVVADEIEGFFTALDIQPLHIKKQDTISSPSAESSGRVSPIQRCASPPLPPKVKLEEPAHLSPAAEVSPSSQPEEHEHDEESDLDQPPAYEESERVQPPPEKPAAAEAQADEEPASSPSLAASAAISAARVGGSVAGVDTEQAAAKDTTEEAEPDEQASNADEATTEPEPAHAAEATSPPPLPPRPAPAPAASAPAPAPATTSTTPQPDTAAQMPGAFPPPPRRSPSPKGSPSSSAKMAYVPGAAATSATAVGAAVAIPSTDFAHGGLAHARRALGQRVSHLIDKAKEHHEARRGSATRGGVEEGKERSVLVVAPIA